MDPCSPALCIACLVSRLCRYSAFRIRVPSGCSAFASSPGPRFSGSPFPRCSTTPCASPAPVLCKVRASPHLLVAFSPCPLCPHAPQPPSSSAVPSCLTPHPSRLTSVATPHSPFRIPHWKMRILPRPQRTGRVPLRISEVSEERPASQRVTRRFLVSMYRAQAARPASRHGAARCIADRPRVYA
jgi:hypothetical protein